MMKQMIASMTNDAPTTGKRKKRAACRRYGQKDPLAADGVREPGPEKASSCVADGDYAHQPRRYRGLDTGPLLCYRVGLGDDGDAGGHVQEQECPERVPMPGFQGTAEFVVHARAFAALLFFGFPTLRRPALWRVLHK